MTRYTHRNGETEAPSESGWYWFRGESDGVADTDLVDVDFSAPHMPIVWSCRVDGWDLLSSYTGQWWGPLTPPWDE